MFHSNVEQAHQIRTTVPTQFTRKKQGRLRAAQNLFLATLGSLPWKIYMAARFCRFPRWDCPDNPPLTRSVACLRAKKFLLPNPNGFPPDPPTMVSQVQTLVCLCLKFETLLEREPWRFKSIFLPTTGPHVALRDADSDLHGL